ncbi:iron-sulfur cluster assembly protein [Algoriphagus antarcticus]|uniref:FeS assembly SUF system protein n=2 Tax=Algoriphagus antarcticus TaxID=238540 RepID=A0A3E0DZD4_9BACT|nr:iron-sulfur cluster assembly protein [Algoriphagus antarcticus]REG91454.1 FeS assembly SUF system protein [Algoriphagus antarcticus]
MSTESKTETTVGQVENLKEKVVQAIKLVYDPEIPVDVYDLGLIYEITVYPVNNVYVLMTLTSPNCPSAEYIPTEVKDKIQQIQGINNVEIELTFDPPYSQDMMSEAAKLELGFL